jgi:beta-phosphoglucomutase
MLDTLSMRTLSAMIFDVDGVLADTEPLHFAGFRQTLAEIGIRLTESDYYAEYLGYDDRGCFLAALNCCTEKPGPFWMQ